ncbi:MAG: tetratricopeptide repeat protein [Bacteroidetes bacterium]|nr:tetratricopeptide repeat protein [Bacteroidota bacterium]
MAKIKKDKASEKNIMAVEEALGKSEQFIEKNQNKIVWVVLAIVLIIGGYIGYNRFIIEPREKEASAEIFMAQKYFEKDNYKMALEGDGFYMGFLDIIDNYGMTKSANLSKYYAGICYLNLGEFENAIDQLGSFKKRDMILGAMAYGAMGDAYLELDNKEEALKNYRKAASHKPNKLTSPIYLLRAAQLEEHMGNYKSALDLYKKIKTDFHGSAEATDIDYYIGRVSGLIK